MDSLKVASLAIAAIAKHVETWQVLCNQITDKTNSLTMKKIAASCQLLACEATMPASPCPLHHARFTITPCFQNQLTNCIDVGPTAPGSSNGTLYEDIRHYTGVSQKVSRDGGDAMLLKPSLYGSLLIGVPICSNDWLHHQHLQATNCLYALSITKLKRSPPPHRQASIEGPSQLHKGLLILTRSCSIVSFNALQSRV